MRVQFDHRSCGRSAPRDPALQPWRGPQRMCRTHASASFLDAERMHLLVMGNEALRSISMIVTACARTPGCACWRTRPRRSAAGFIVARACTFAHATTVACADALCESWREGTKSKRQIRVVYVLNASGIKFRESCRSVAGDDIQLRPVCRRAVATTLCDGFL